MKLNIFYDLEFTCPNRHSTFKPEVIQIGAVKIDENNNVISTFSRYVKPIENPIITDVCRELTGIVQEDIDISENFNVVFNEFSDWAGNDQNTKFYSWGPDDIRVIKYEIISKNIKLDFSEYFLNHCYDFQEKLKKQTGIILSLKKMLRCFEKEFIGTEHNALADAINLKDLFIVSFNSPDLIAKIKFETTIDACKHQLEKIINLSVPSLNDKIADYYNYICDLNLRKQDLSIKDRNDTVKLIENTVNDLNSDIEKYIINKFYKDIDFFIKDINKKFTNSRFICKPILSTSWHNIAKKYKFFYKHAHNNKLMFSFIDFYSLYKYFNDKIYYMLTPQAATQLKIFNSEFNYAKKADSLLNLNRH